MVNDRLIWRVLKEGYEGGEIVGWVERRGEDGDGEGWRFLLFSFYNFHFDTHVEINH